MIVVTIVVSGEMIAATTVAITGMRGVKPAGIGATTDAMIVVTGVMITAAMAITGRHRRRVLCIALRIGRVTWRAPAMVGKSATATATITVVRSTW